MERGGLLADKPKNPGDTLSKDTASTARERLDDYLSQYRVGTTVATLAAFALAPNMLSTSDIDENSVDTIPVAFHVSTENTATNELVDPAAEATTIPTVEPTFTVPTPTEATPSTAPTVKPSVKPTPKPAPKPTPKPAPKWWQEKPEWKKVPADCKIDIVAHRGASATERENTLNSFKRAVERGANIVETDALRTKDGVWVLHHDPTIKGRDIEKTSYAKLKKLDPNLLTLRQYAKWFSKNTDKSVKTAIEFKSRDKLSKGDMKSFGRELNRYGISKRAIINARQSNRSNLTGYRKMMLKGEVPRSKMALIVRDKESVARMKREGITIAFTSMERTTSAFVRKADKAGIDTYVWTPKKMRDIKKYIRMKGLDGVVVNNAPAVVRECDPGQTKRAKVEYRLHGVQTGQKTRSYSGVNQSINKVRRQYGIR